VEIINRLHNWTPPNYWFGRKPTQSSNTNLTARAQRDVIPRCATSLATLADKPNWFAGQFAKGV